MTTQTHGGSTTGTAETGEQAQIPLSRLVRVELRKLVDTRSGFWLLVAIAAITAVVVVITLFAADPRSLTFSTFIAATGIPQGTLLPVLGIMAVTTEWTQRTSLITFSLEPRRSRVVVAKVVATLLGLAAVIVAIVLAVLANLLGMAVRDGAGDWDGLGGSGLPDILLGQALGVLQGLGYGMVFLNTAVAIVVFFAAPTAMSILVNTVSGLADAAPWIDFGTAQQPLFGGTALTGQEWAQLAVAATIWVVLPFVGGVWRLLRREVK